jgi:hypothetical protein
MAIPSSPPQTTCSSLIERLPAELLENILLEVVSDVKSPVIYLDDGNENLRCDEEID